MQRQTNRGDTRRNYSETIAQHEGAIVAMQQSKDFQIQLSCEQFLERLDELEKDVERLLSLLNSIDGATRRRRAKEGFIMGLNDIRRHVAISMDEA